MHVCDCVVVPLPVSLILMRVARHGRMIVACGEVATKHVLYRCVTDAKNVVL